MKKSDDDYSDEELDLLLANREREDGGDDEEEEETDEEKGTSAGSHASLPVSGDNDGLGRGRGRGRGRESGPRQSSGGVGRWVSLACGALGTARHALESAAGNTTAVATAAAVRTARRVAATPRSVLYLIL
jgi:hypothetical protein